MNNFVVSGCVTNAKLTSKDDKHTCHADFQFFAKDSDEPVINSKLKAWGKTAQIIAGLGDKGANLILVASLNVDSNADGSLSLALQVNEVNDAYEGAEIHNPLNVINLVGRAGRDPEVRYFESGRVVADFSLAVNRTKDQPPNWFNLEIWGKQAQVAADYIRKGSLLGVTGKFDVARWTDRSSGEERSKALIRVDRLELLGSRRDAESSDGSFGGSAVLRRGGAASQPTTSIF